jgi:hypothetical protein
MGNFKIVDRFFGNLFGMWMHSSIILNYGILARLATPRQTVSVQRSEPDTRPPVNLVTGGFLPEESPGSKGQGAG